MKTVSIYLDALILWNCDLKIGAIFSSFSLDNFWLSLKLPGFDSGH